MLAASDGVCCPSPARTVARWLYSTGRTALQDCWSQRLLGKGTQTLSFGTFGPGRSRTCSQAVPQTCVSILAVKGSHLLWSFSARSQLSPSSCQVLYK